MPTTNKEESGDQGEGSNPEQVLVFLCYRQLDGVRVAEWLFELLDGHDLGTGSAKRLKVYFDRTAQVAGDWRTLHEPSLKTARSFIFVTSPGAFARHEGEDWVHLELDWWLKNRKTPPIVVDPTHTDGKWVPRSIRKRWPNGQRVNLDLDGMTTLLPEQERRCVDNITVQICQSILFGADSVAFDDFVRQRRLARMAWVLSFLLAAVAGLSIWFGASATTASRRADEARGLALGQLRNAIHTIERMTQCSWRLEDKAAGRELLAASVEGYNKVLAEPAVDDPDFQFERAWILNRLSVALRESFALGMNQLGKRWDGYLTDPEHALQLAIEILEGQIKISDEWRFRLELGDAWLTAATNSFAAEEYDDAIQRAQNAVTQFESLNRMGGHYLCKRQLSYACDRLAQAQEAGLKAPREVVVAYDAAARTADDAVLQATREFGSLSSEELDARQHRFDVNRRQLAFLGVFENVSSTRLLRHWEDGLELAFDLSTQDALAGLRVVSSVLLSSGLATSLFRSKAANLKGDIEARLDRHEEAFKSFLAAARMLDAVASRSPDEDSQFAAALNNMADAHGHEDTNHEFGSAVRMAERALELQQRAIASKPDSLEFRGFRRYHRIVLGRMLFQSGQTANAELQVRALLDEVGEDVALVTRPSALAEPRDRDAAQQRTHLKITCLNGAELSKRIGNQELERKMLESFLELRSPRALEDTVGIMEFPHDMKLVASILIRHAAMIAEVNPESAEAECGEAQRILERIAKEHPFAPDFEEAARMAATQCNLLRASMQAAPGTRRADQEPSRQRR